MIRILHVVLIWLIFLLIGSDLARAGRRPDTINVLLIMSDDLRADISPYSSKYATFTPNIDKFARGALVFNNAYTQQALCGPSRNAFLSGRRPDSLKSWNFLNSLRKFSSQVQTIPEAFKKAGYSTISIGKIFHVYDDIREDKTNSWNNVMLSPGTGDEDRSCLRSSIWCTCDSKACVDGIITQSAIDIIKNRDKNNNKTPFFLAVGYRRPHPDFVIDAKFPSFSEYEMGIPAALEAPNFDQPNGMPSAAFYACTNLVARWQFQDELMLPWMPVNSDMQSRVRMAYWRSVAYMDSQFGRLLETLDQSSFADNTIVIFMSDHGYTLGERAMWCKQNVFEVATRVPLIMRVPWFDESFGKRTSAIVELVDIFPTLVSLVGPVAPKLSINECADGRDHASVFKDPEGYNEKSIRDPYGGIDADAPDLDLSDASFAVSQFPRCIDPKAKNMWAFPCSQTDTFGLMGYSIRTNRWRYTEWRVWLGNIADWSPAGLNSVELYDHSIERPGQLDYDLTENDNLAPLHPDVVSKLARALRAVVIESVGTKSSACLPKSAGTVSPTLFPSQHPTLMPSRSPTSRLTVRPTLAPTTSKPTKTPTSKPTRNPTASPQVKSTRAPTKSPNPRTSKSPTKKTTNQPSSSVTSSPTTTKTTTPQPTSVAPSTKPTSTTDSPSHGIVFTGQPTTASPTTASPTTVSPTTDSPTSTSLITPQPTSWDEPQANCRDSKEFCSNVDWFCGVQQQCNADGEEVTVNCPCWEYVRVEHEQLTDSEGSSAVKTRLLHLNYFVLVLSIISSVFV